MKRIIQTAFIILFLAVLAFPILFFNRKGRISETEKRTLSAKPELLTNHRLNQNFFSEYDSYFNDRFGGRNELVLLNAKINKLMNNSLYMCNDRAIQGKDGWYFYIRKKDSDNLKDFYKTNLMTDQEIDTFKNRISEAAGWCEDHNIKYIFLIAPNKHSVYEEFYPFIRPKGKTRCDQQVKVFEELKVPYVFPRDLLISKKSDYDFPLYYETDTHWNPQGAYIAFTVLYEKIKSLFPETNFPKIEYKTEIEYNMNRGDLLSMLNIEKSKSTWPTLTPVGHTNADFYKYRKYEGEGGDKGCQTESPDKSLPRAIIFRDSFFIALEPFTSPLFSEADYIWHLFDSSYEDYVLNYKPDLIIFESVERNSLYLGKF